MTDYSSQVYWENRYLNDHMEIFEWYQTYDSLKEKIIDFLKPEDQILYIGCGTSKLAEDLYIDEFKNVTNIDFSENAIKIMEDRYKEQKVEMNYKVMNAENMSEFNDGQFNVGAMATGFFYFTKKEVEAPIIKFVDVQKYATLGNIEE